MNTQADTSLHILLQHLRNARQDDSPVLWLADEHHNSAIPQLVPYRSQLTLLSNRFDVAQQAQQSGLTSQFSDWRPAGLHTFAGIYLRICKEKPVNLHLLKLAFRHLRAGGALYLAGQKSGGIKTLAKQAEKIFSSPCPLKKSGTAYFGTVTRTTNSLRAENSEAFDLSEYYQLRAIGQWRHLNLQSKFGVYGWDKIDQGSELLIESVESYLQQYSPRTESMLDIGCGYGFLSLATAAIPCVRRVATDNNAAALLCTKINADNHGVDIDVVASDCGNTIDGRFDVVLCNPPFHKGFDVESDLTQRFVRSAAQKTHKHGVAFFVVNSFIALEKTAKAMFAHHETLANNGRFKVIALKHQKNRSPENRNA